MGNFKRIKRTGPIEHKYVNKVVVYLESEADVLILRDRWFFDVGERLEFASVDVEGSGGCTKVVNQVHSDREAGIEAFGIVDRDALLRENRWDLFFETDDVIFDAERPYGAWVTVLRRWEIENYLLVPEAVNDYLSDSTDGRLRSVAATTEQMLDCAESLIPQIAANVLLHQMRKRKMPSDFGHQADDAVQMKEEVCRYLTSGEGSDCEESDLAGYILRIQRFAEDQPERDGKRWGRLSRLIDGKLFVRRFFHSVHRLGHEHRFHLATRIREKRCIDPEIVGHIERLAGSSWSLISKGRRT